MLKQVIAMILLSVGIIISMSYAQHFLDLLIRTHQFISHALTDVFSGGQAGNLARGLIALLSVPVLVGLIPSLIYWTIKRSWFPYFMEIVWVIWLLQAGALIIMYKAI